VLLAAMVLLILGYSMAYSAFHGNWQFWKYWLPKTAVNPNA
jgi:hypothetical protein